jgi:hypothetical protein
VIYHRLGLVNDSLIERMDAERWSTDIDIFQDARPADQGQQANIPRAKYEPLSGCYLGAFAVSDVSLPVVKDGSGRRIPREAILGQVIGKHLATAFDYCRYGDRFPLTWARQLVAHGIAPQIALEPNNGLQAVQDNAYLRQFARDAAECGGPVFIRFASEMNGNWTNYHRDPALYRAKFRLVHDVMHLLAPNVAMIWCVYEIPEYNLDAYYPGDAYVDWVGVNIYSVLHHNNQPGLEGWYENPVSLLKTVYSRFSARKPIAICEYGASHMEALSPDVDFSLFARVRLTDLLTALPRLYPRVKLIDIFDCNNLKYARAGRRVNDYCVTDSPSVLDSFRKLVAPDYFLSRITDGTQAVLPGGYSPVQDREAITAPAHFTAWVKTYDNVPTVIFSLDTHRLASFTAPATDSITLDPALYTAGIHRLTVTVLDRQGRVAGRKHVLIRFPKASPSLQARGPQAHAPQG